MLSELVTQGCIREVRVSASLPSKGKALNSTDKRVWIVTVILVNGSEARLLSTRGSQREWASLDRLTEWLRAIGLGNYHVIQMEDRQ